MYILPKGGDGKGDDSINRRALENARTFAANYFSFVIVSIGFGRNATNPNLNSNEPTFFTFLRGITVIAHDSFGLYTPSLLLVFLFDQYIYNVASLAL